jgi:hypothetical protein
MNLLALQSPLSHHSSSTCSSLFSCANSKSLQWSSWWSIFFSRCYCLSTNLLRDRLIDCLSVRIFPLLKHFFVSQQTTRLFVRHRVRKRHCSRILVAIQNKLSTRQLSISPNHLSRKSLVINLEDLACPLNLLQLKSDVWRKSKSSLPIDG